MPIASAKASPRIMLVWMTGWASGFRPRASMARPTRLPMARAGPKAPRPIAIPAPRNLMPSSVMANFVLSWAAIRRPSTAGGTRARNRSIYTSLPWDFRFALLVRLLGGACRRRAVHALSAVWLPVGDGHHAEDQGEHGEDERLDDPHEQLQT